MAIELADHCCLSGGAIGADTIWGQAAVKAGHQVIHFGFSGHRTTAPNPVVLSESMLQQADRHCRAANQILGRTYPPRSRYLTNLLRRSWYSVEPSGSLYAITHFEDNQIAGGTAWAVIMFLLKHDFAPCSAYVFDQEVCRWYAWTEQQWQPIYEPPKPRDIWTGIGARKINMIGRLAITVLMQ